MATRLRKSQGSAFPGDPQTLFVQLTRSGGLPQPSRLWARLNGL